MSTFRKIALILAPTLSYFPHKNNVVVGPRGFPSPLEQALRNMIHPSVRVMYDQKNFVVSMVVSLITFLDGSNSCHYDVMPGVVARR